MARRRPSRAFPDATALPSKPDIRRSPFTDNARLARKSGLIPSLDDNHPFHGANGPPGRRGAQCDAVEPNCECSGGKGRTACPIWGLRRTASPHRRPRSLALLPPTSDTWGGRLVAAHTTAPPAPSERTRDCCEMGDYHRDLVSIGWPRLWSQMSLCGL
jgi:hypothetical protein